MIDKTKKRKARGVLKEQYGTVGVKQNGVVTERLKLSRIKYLSEDGKQYVFLKNNFTLSPKQIAIIYKNRCKIELLFKQIKQNFPLRYFWGEFERHQDADLLRFDRSVTHGLNTKESSNEKIVCQRDYSNTAAFNKLCRVV